MKVLETETKEGSQHIHRHLSSNSTRLEVGLGKAGGSLSTATIAAAAPSLAQVSLSGQTCPARFPWDPSSELLGLRTRVPPSAPPALDLETASCSRRSFPI